LLSYLKVLVNPQDDISLRRIINVPKRSIGDATVGKVQDFADDFELDLWDALTQARSIPSLTARNATCIEKFTTLMDNFMELKDAVPVSVLIESILKDTGYLDELSKSNEIEDKSRIENLKELVSDAVDFEKSSEDKSLEAYLEKVSLVQDTDKLEEEDEGEGSVVLMTVHSAKGLEFPVVFMVGMENGIFPSEADFNEEDKMEESRRLCYVAITRAKEMLYMTSAEVRKQFGRTVAYSQSDFIGEIKSDLKEYINERGLAGTSTFAKPMNTGVNNPHSLRNNMYSSNRNISGASNTSGGSGTSITSDEITMGRKVKHDKFGVGTIVSITPSGNDKKLTIAFDKQGVKMLMLSMANLEVL
ncbi:MAG: 3'-5' exonuclease, partial [Clostridium paraputrificum]